MPRRKPRPEKMPYRYQYGRGRYIPPREYNEHPLDPDSPFVVGGFVRRKKPVDKEELEVGILTAFYIAGKPPHVCARVLWLVSDRIGNLGVSYLEVVEGK